MVMKNIMMKNVSTLFLVSFIQIQNLNEILLLGLKIESVLVKE